MQPVEYRENREEDGGGGTPERRIEGLLCYLFGFVSGGILYITSKDGFVRFHAMQSILFNIALLLVWLAISLIGSIVGFLPLIGPIILGVVTFILFLASAAIWVYLMAVAFMGRTYKLPVIGDLAERLV